MAPVELHISGTGTQFRHPERAIIHLKVRFENEVQDKVAVDLQQTTSDLQTKIRGLCPLDAEGNVLSSAPVVEWENESLTIGSMTESWYEGSKQKTKLKFYSQTSFSVRFRDYDALGRFAGQLSHTKGVSVSHVEWILLPETQKILRTQAIKEAYREAVSKAEAYADAMGFAEVRPKKIMHGQSAPYDEDRGMHRVQQMARKQNMSTSSSTHFNDSFALTMVPQKVLKTVSCTIEFEIW